MRLRRLTFSLRRDRDQDVRCSHISPRRDRDIGKMRLETETETTSLAYIYMENAVVLSIEAVIMGCALLLSHNSMYFF